MSSIREVQIEFFGGKKPYFKWGEIKERITPRHIALASVGGLAAGCMLGYGAKELYSKLSSSDSGSSQYDAIHYGASALGRQLEENERACLAALRLVPVMGDVLVASNFIKEPLDRLTAERNRHEIQLDRLKSLDGDLTKAAELLLPEPKPKPTKGKSYTPPAYVQSPSSPRTDAALANWVIEDINDAIAFLRVASELLADSHNSVAQDHADIKPLFRLDIDLDDEPYLQLNALKEAWNSMLDERAKPAPKDADGRAKEPPGGRPKSEDPHWLPMGLKRLGDHVKVKLPIGLKRLGTQVKDKPIEALWLTCTCGLLAMAGGPAVGIAAVAVVVAGGVAVDPPPSDERSATSREKRLQREVEAPYNSLMDLYESYHSLDGEKFPRDRALLRLIWETRCAAYLLEHSASQPSFSRKLIVFPPEVLREVSSAATAETRAEADGPSVATGASQATPASCIADRVIFLEPLLASRAVRGKSGTAETSRTAA